jgi:hypothetical protein
MNTPNIYAYLHQYAAEYARQEMMKTELMLRDALIRSGQSQDEFIANHVLLYERVGCDPYAKKRLVTREVYEAISQGGHPMPFEVEG